MAKKKEVTKTRRVFKKRPCRLCRDNTKAVDYKEVDLLQRFITERGKILATRLSGNCSKHQRMVSNAIKKARLAALLPFVKITSGTQRERGGSSGSRGGKR